MYGAWDMQASRRLAVKILTPDAGNASSTRARFEREARILDQLRSPHTVRLFEHGNDPTGLLYLVFERVDGEDLFELLERAGPMEPTIALDVTRQLLEALAEAHGRGLLHRDVKPSNVRVAPTDGGFRVKLLDFGLARATDDGHPSITKTGDLVGTPRYMSPEQLLGERLTPACDVYSVGMMLYEMLLGPDALQGNRWADQLDRLRSGHVFGITQLERIPPDVQKLVATMSARRAEDRYPDAGAALRDLAPPSAAPTLTPPPPPPARRPLVPVALVAIALVAIGGLVAFVARPDDRPAAPPPHAPTRRENPLAQRPLAAPTPAASENASSDGAADGCGEPPPHTGTGDMRLGEFDAPMLFHVPVTYDPSERHPLLVIIHQNDDNPRNFLGDTGFGALADELGFVVAAPEYLPHPGVGPAPHQIATTKEAIGIADARLCIDHTRIWIASQGKSGQFAAEIACQPWVTALATNSYRPLIAERVCENTRPVPHLMISGRHNRVYPVAGGDGCKKESLRKVPLDKTEAAWREVNSCTGRPRAYGEPHPNGECHTWDCATTFVSCIVEGGHGWPGSVPRNPYARECHGKPADYPTSRRVIEFFLAAPPLPAAAP